MNQQTKELTQCKHCEFKLEKRHLHFLPLKDLFIKYHQYWAGQEIHQLQIIKVSCPKCKKKYSVKEKKKRYFYK